MHAVGLGALQQRHVAQLRRGGLQRTEQIAQHQVVGPDLLVFPPARDQPRPLVKGGVDEVSDAGEVGREGGTSGGIGEIEGQPARAKRLIRPAPGQR